jgi:hypothetical protein
MKTWTGFVRSAGLPSGATIGVAVSCAANVPGKLRQASKYEKASRLAESFMIVSVQVTVLATAWA